VSHSRSSDLSYWDGVTKGGSELGDWSGVGKGLKGRSSQRGGQFGDGSGDFGDWRSVSEGCGVCDGGGSDWGNSFDGNGGGFLANYGVESVDWVSGVVDSTPGTISLQEGVATLNEVAIAGLMLAFGVAGQTVVHVVGVAVLWMRVEIGINGLSHHGFGHGGGDNRGARSVSQGRRENTGVGDSHEGSENDELQKSIMTFKLLFGIPNNYKRTCFC